MQAVYAFNTHRNCVCLFRCQTTLPISGLSSGLRNGLVVIIRGRRAAGNIFVQLSSGGNDILPLTNISSVENPGKRINPFRFTKAPLPLPKRWSAPLNGLSSIASWQRLT